MVWLPLAPQARWLFHAQALVQYVVFWIPATLFAAFSAMQVLSLELSQAAGGGAIWLFVQLLWAIWMPSLAWDRWSYALRTDDLLVAHGVLIHTVTAIPLQRVQHVDVRQGPIERMFGLARVMIYTAAGMGADGVIPGLRLADAEALRDRLVRVAADDVV